MIISVRTRTRLVLLLLTCLSLGLAFALKDRCNGPEWDGFHARALCYNDLAALHGFRHMDTDTLPYVSHPNDNRTDPDLTHRWGFNEYPPLIGMFMWTAAKLGTLRASLSGGPESQPEYFYWQSVMLMGFAFATVLLLLQMTDRPKRVAYFAAGTPLVCYAFTNYDLIPVFFTVLGLFAWERRRFLLGGTAFGLATAAKLYPAILIPFLLAALIRKGKANDSAFVGPGPRGLAPVNGLRNAATFAAAAAGTALAVYVPFLLFGSPDLVAETFRIHLDRPPSAETAWVVLWYYGTRWNIGWMTTSVQDPWPNLVAVALFLLAASWLLRLTWQGRLGAREACLGVLLAMLALTKVYSLQYVLWLLPFWVLVPLRRWTYGYVVAVDFLSFFNFFSSFAYEYESPPWMTHYRWLAIGIILRTLGYLCFFVLVCRNSKRLLGSDLVLGGSRTSFAWPRFKSQVTGMLFVLLGSAVLLASALLDLQGATLPSLHADTVPAILLLTAGLFFFLGAWRILNRWESARPSMSTDSE